MTDGECGLVFEREVDVPGAGDRDGADFADDADGGEGFFEHQLDLRVRALLVSGFTLAGSVGNMKQPYPAGSLRSPAGLN